MIHIMEVWEIQEPVSADDIRGAKRLDVVFRAGLRERGTTRFDIKVVDLSITGFRCETSCTLVPGSSIWLTIPGLAPLEARVAWRDKFRYGCAFAHPLHIAVFDHIVMHQG
jgi:hypothetical protein